MNVVSIGSFENLVAVKGVARSDVTVAATAVDLGMSGETALDGTTQRVTVFVCDAAVRFTLDGSTPSATHGAPASAGTAITMSRQQALAFKAVRSGSDSAKLYVVEQVFANGAR